MSGNNNSSSIKHYIIGASDLAFVLLFFFMVIGGEPETVEPVQLPTKTVEPDTFSTPEIVNAIKAFIGPADTLSSDSSRLKLSFEGQPPLEDSMTWSNVNLARFELHNEISLYLQAFIQQCGIPEDSVRVDIYSDPVSFYGFIAGVIAACKKNQYDCFLMFEARSG